MLSRDLYKQLYSIAKEQAGNNILNKWEEYNLIEKNIFNKIKEFPQLIIMIIIKLIDDFRFQRIVKIMNISKLCNLNTNNYNTINIMNTQNANSFINPLIPNNRASHIIHIVPKNKIEEKDN